MIPEALQWYADASKESLSIALLGLPFCMVLALFMAAKLWLRGDKKYKELI